MSTYPPPEDILDAVARFLRDEAAPVLKGSAAFNLRVSLNAIELVRRELTLGAAAEAKERAGLEKLLGEDGNLDTLRETLCDRLAAGDLTLEDAALRDHLRAVAIERLAIDQPSYSAYIAATREP